MGGLEGVLCRQRDASARPPESNWLVLNTASDIIMIFCGSHNRDHQKSWYPLQILAHVLMFAPCFYINQILNLVGNLFRNLKNSQLTLWSGHIYFSYYIFGRVSSICISCNYDCPVQILTLGKYRVVPKNKEKDNLLSTSAQVMACFPTTPSYYPNQCMNSREISKQRDWVME